MSYIDIEVIPGGAPRSILGEGVGYIMVPVSDPTILGNNPFQVSKRSTFPPEYDALSSVLQVMVSNILAQPGASDLWVWRLNDAGSDGTPISVLKEVSVPKPDGYKSTFGIIKGPIDSIDAVYLNLNKLPGDTDYGDHLLLAGQDDAPEQGGTSGITDIVGTTKTITITGEWATHPELAVGKSIVVSGTTLNDGTYTVFSATNNSGFTDIIVDEGTLVDETGVGTLDWGYADDNYDILTSQGKLTGQFTLKGTWTAPSGKTYDANVQGVDRFPPPGSTLKVDYTYKNTGYILGLRDLAERKGVRLAVLPYRGLAGSPASLVPESTLTGVYTGENSGGGTLLDDHLLLRSAVTRAAISYKFVHAVCVLPPDISASDSDGLYSNSDYTFADWKNALGSERVMLVTADSDDDYGPQFMGQLMGLPPQHNPMLQPINGVVARRYDGSKWGGLEDAQINVIMPNEDLADTIRTAWGYTTSSDGQLKWIDDSRVKDELKYKMKVELTALLADPNMKQNFNGIARIKSRVKSVYTWAGNKTMIDGIPRRYIDIPLENAFLTPADARTQEQTDLIEASKIARSILDMTSWYYYSGTPRRLGIRIGAI